MDTVNEQSTAYLTVVFTDKTGAVVTPTSISWTVYDKISGTLLFGPESVTPSSTIELVLPPTVNTIIDTRRLLETKVVTVSTSYGANDGVNDQYEYNVKNLRYIT